MREWISQIDEQIREGQGTGARRAIEARLEDPVDRPWLAEVAALCRRTGMPERSVRLLSPVVRPKARAVIQATPLETAEYAAGLIQIGADREGMKLLSALDGRALPRAWFFEALARFSRWDYEGAIPLLDQYVAHPALTPYERRIGQVNLAAAQVATERDAPLLTELLARTLEEGLRLLHANLREIRAQALIGAGRYPEARASLEQAHEFMREMGNADALFVKKWRAILARKEGEPEARAELARVQAEAFGQGHWETVRDCDFHLERFDRLYFGTPFESYRARILRQGYQPAAHYDWKLGATAGRRLDPHACAELKPGQLLQRLLLALSRDFYRPLRLPALHAELFPERFYHPINSPTVIHQAIKRLRAWACAQDLPLEIVESKGAYRLAGPVTLRVRDPGAAPESPLLRVANWLEKVRKRLPSNACFGHGDAMKHGGASSRSTHRLLSEAVLAGLLRKEGRGKKTRYSFASRL